MTDQIEALNTALLVREAATHADWRQNHSGVTTGGDNAYRAAVDAGREMRNLARVTAANVEYLAADDTMFPEGRERLIREAGDAARREMRRLGGVQEAALAVLEKEMELAAMPHLDSGREMPARDEARMILDGHPDPLTMMCELARSGGELAAVVVGSFGESYLRARGVPAKDVANQHSVVRLQSLMAARSSSEPKAAKAARARFAMDDLRSIAGVARHGVRETLESARVTL